MDDAARVREAPGRLLKCYLGAVLRTRLQEESAGMIASTCCRPCAAAARAGARAAGAQSAARAGGHAARVPSLPGQLRGQRRLGGVRLRARHLPWLPRQAGRAAGRRVPAVPAPAGGGAVARGGGTPSRRWARGLRGSPWTVKCARGSPRRRAPTVGVWRFEELVVGWAGCAARASTARCWGRCSACLTSRAAGAGGGCAEHGRLPRAGRRAGARSWQGRGV